MRPRSSTSSSSRVPWAFVVAVALCLAVEGALRAAAFERTTPYAWGLREYDAAALRLRTEGPPDIMVVGTSRAREALDLPRLRAHLEAALGTSPSIGGYALSGARAGEVRAVVELALRHGAPRLLLLGLDPRLFQGTAQHADRQARFEPLGLAARETTAHAHLGALLRAYGGRRRLGDFVRGAGSLERRTSPLGGGATDFQRASPSDSFVGGPGQDAWIEAYLARVLEGGRYDMTAQRVATVGRILTTCAVQGVPVVLFEVPLSRAWQRHLPLGTLEAFYEIARVLAVSHEVPFVSAEALGLAMEDEHFYEPSHLNRVGARLLTDALARTVIVPHLRATSLGR